MAAVLLDGEAVAARVRAEVADRVARLGHEGIHVGLGTVLVGTDGPSERYVAMKHADCAEVGIVSVGEQLPETATQAEVEEVVRSHPAVHDAVVVGLPDPRTGERACAVVVLHPGTTVDLDGLVAVCADKGLARYKHPEQLEIVDALPRDGMGKVRKTELRDRFG